MNLGPMLIAHFYLCIFYWHTHRELKFCAVWWYTVHFVIIIFALIASILCAMWFYVLCLYVELNNFLFTPIYVRKEIEREKKNTGQNRGEKIKPYTQKNNCSAVHTIAIQNEFNLRFTSVLVVNRQESDRWNEKREFRHGP